MGRIRVANQGGRVAKPQRMGVDNGGKSNWQWGELDMNGKKLTLTTEPQPCLGLVAGAQDMCKSIRRDCICRSSGNSDHSEPGCE